MNVFSVNVYTKVKIVLYFVQYECNIVYLHHTTVPKKLLSFNTTAAFLAGLF